LVRAPQTSLPAVRPRCLSRTPMVNSARLRAAPVRGEAKGPDGPARRLRCAGFSPRQKQPNSAGVGALAATACVCSATEVFVANGDGKQRATARRPGQGRSQARGCARPASEVARPPGGPR